jgi:pimeloyl-ACP methyl ester carboxylesterase
MKNQARAESALAAFPAPRATALPTDWREVDWREYRRSLLIDECRANIVELGEGPSVVFVHGLGGSWQNWLENLLPLARDHRVIAIDLPGFGRSEMPEGKVTISGWARWLDRLCDILEIEAASFVGNSMGGFICADLAILFPQRVEIGESFGQAALARALAAPEAIVRRRRGRKLLMWAIAAHPEELSPPLVWEQLRGVPTPGFVPALDALTSYPIRDRLRQISCPTLIVWGERDRLVPLRDAHEFRRLIGDSRLLVYEDTGHVPMLERPERFNRDLLAFLAEDREGGAVPEKSAEALQPVRRELTAR